MEILPKTAFIQARAEFSAQLKFIARSSLKQDAVDCFDPETGVLEIPLHIKVADQVFLNFWFFDKIFLNILSLIKRKKL